MNNIREYYEEFLIYLKKIERTIRKSIRRFKYYFNHPKSKFMQNVRYYLKEIIKPEYRKSLTITGSILFFLILVLVLSFSSYAYYQDNVSFPVFQARVGHINNYDAAVLVYIEDRGQDGEGKGIYHITENIPTIGYSYSGYSCINNSTLIYDEITSTVTYTSNQIESCSLFFNVSAQVDAAINIMVETGVESYDYVNKNNIPYYGYIYDRYECTNNHTLEYDNNNHSITVELDSLDYCNIYFKKLDTKAEVKLFVKEGNDFVELNYIPSNINYRLNNQSECVNENNERVDGIISYNNGVIEINTQDNLSCNVYLEKND